MIVSLAKRASDGLRSLPLLFGRPSVLLLWLLTAHAAQIVLAALLLTVPTLVMPRIDARLEEMYPPTVSTTVKKRFLGVIRRDVYERTEDPRLDSRKKLFRAVGWSTGGGIVAFLFLIHIPPALSRANARAKQLESEADAFAGAQPLRAMLLYRSALKWATDEALSASLGEKIIACERMDAGSALRTPISQSAGDATTIDDATVVLSPSASVTGGSVHAEPQVGPESRYRIKETLGQGTMGVTYLAEDTVLERDVALKEILPNRLQDGRLVARFRQEAKVLAKLAHPGIVQIYDFVQDKTRFWIVMELVPGDELEAQLRERGAMPPAEAARIGVLMAEAMAYAHAKGIVHRDFKPSNVMMTRDGQPKIMDFGLAKLAESGQGTQIGTILGSPLYMSPEQAAGRESDARSDIYSLGVVLYRMLTGKTPFAGENFASILSQHINADPAPPRSIVPGLPEELDALVLSMLAKDPEKRIQDMTVVSSSLRKFSA